MARVCCACADQCGASLLPHATTHRLKRGVKVQGPTELRSAKTVVPTRVHRTHAMHTRNAYTQCTHAMHARNARTHCTHTLHAHTELGVSCVPRGCPVRGAMCGCSTGPLSSELCPGVRSVHCGSPCILQTKGRWLCAMPASACRECSSDYQALPCMPLHALLC